jgi:hypothetical protein
MNASRGTLAPSWT